MTEKDLERFPPEVRGIAPTPDGVLSTIVEAASCGQDGSGKLFAVLQKNKFLRDVPQGKWYKCQNGLWVLDKANNALSMVDPLRLLFLEAVPILEKDRQEAKDAGDNGKVTFIETQIAVLQKAAKRLLSLNEQLAVLGLCAKGDGFYSKDEGDHGKASLAFEGGERWDRGTYLLPCANGLLNLKTKEIKELRPDDFIRTASPVAYEANADDELWEKTVAEAMGEDEIQERRERKKTRFLQKCLGYGLCKDPIEHKMIVLYGKGRNGKGLIAESLQAVLGKLSTTVKNDLFLESKSQKPAGSATPELEKLYGKMLCFTSELPENRRWDASELKHLTGGDTITTRAPFQINYWDFSPTHLFVLLTNWLPHGNADDFALWKRLLVFPFRFSYVDSPLPEKGQRKVNYSLPGILKKTKNQKGILRWLVDGAYAWQEEGLTDIPDELREYLAEYRRAEDILQDFFDARCEFGPNLKAKSGELHEAYVEWCGTLTPPIKKPLSSKAFGERLGRREELEKGKSCGCAVYYGIALKSKN